MEQKMLKLEEWMDIRDLHRQGCSIRQIARLTGHTPRTVRRKLAEQTPQPFAAPPRLSDLDPYKSYLEERFREFSLSAVRLLEEIRPMGYGGSIYPVRRFLNNLRPAVLAARKATVRFETPPGQQAQADWAYCGRFEDATGKTIPIYCFVYVLGFSRVLFVRFTTSMDLPTLIACHQRAFEYLGGWPREILYDNMKQVKLAPSEWNPLFVDFAGHYGFTPKTHRIRRPRTKGKVERMVQYVRDNFLNGRAFADLDDLNAQGLAWLETTANIRLHATTGRRPVDLLGQEGLTPFAAIKPYTLYPARTAKVSAESFVTIGSSRYSVPPSHVGQTVIVVVEEQTVLVRSGGLIVAEHRKADRTGSCVAAKEHIEALWKLSTASQEASLPHWQMTFSQDVAATPLSQYDQIAEVAA
jgi:transposase